jgi:hypothetical protein
LPTKQTGIARSATRVIEDLTKLSPDDDYTGVGNVMYKWQDDERVWHFSDSISEDGQDDNLTTGDISKTR